MLNIAILGAGAVGTAAARFAARAGHRVTVFEQFGLDHDRGSSHGPSRIIRRTYPDRLYTELMGEAYALWDDLEVEANAELRIRTGGIYFGPADHLHLAGTLKALEDCGVPYDVLAPAEATELFPAFAFKDDDCVVYQDDAGILRASECVRAQMRVTRAHGARLCEGARVREVRPIEGGLRVVAEDGEQGSFDRVLFAAGAWTPQLLADLGLPLRPTLQRVIYVRPASRPGPSRFALGRFPVWIDAVPAIAGHDPERAMYGFPSHPGAPGVKVALHEAGPEVDPDAPDSGGRTAWRLQDAGTEACATDAASGAGEAEHVAALTGYLRHRLPDLGAGQIVARSTCLYTMTPDHDFVIDRVPHLAGAWFASACSGHGFKFSILVGKLLVELAEAGGTGRDLARFGASRFAVGRSSQPIR
ncbi:MAG: N-methyl-L-tryptophan oxidase [Candidatus Sericytochromatia bacterium]|nr:N-methyl-L-tryptophan oxidase [Candidatus Tanganyikabacteria bacterium]